MSWFAGWNMPGCTPEVAPVEFDERIDAHNYILDAVERFWDEDADTVVNPDGEDWSEEDTDRVDGRWLPVHTALHLDSSGEFQERTGDGSLVFWITEQD